MFVSSGKRSREREAEEAALEKQRREVLSTEERDAAARAEAHNLEEERAETRKRLELSCREIANDPKLLRRLTKVARKAGVIGEDASFRGAKYTTDDIYDDIYDLVY